MSRIQLEGEIMFGLTAEALVDYSDEVSNLMLNTTRNLVARPPTYGTPRSEQRAGSRQDQVTINFFSDEANPSGLWALFYEAQTTTDSAELFWSANWKAGETSETNPQFTGIITVADMDTGGPVGEWKQQSKTYPAREVEGPITGS